MKLHIQQWQLPVHDPGTAGRQVAAGYELILFTSGSGLGHIGSYTGEFRAGDAFLLGGSLAGHFRCSGESPAATAVSASFREDSWGEGFLKLPECSGVRALLERSVSGVKLRDDSRELGRQLAELERAEGFRRLWLLGECLDQIAAKQNYECLYARKQAPHTKYGLQLEKVFSYTAGHYKELIELEQIAAIAGLSVPAFCNLFKRWTRKTYTGYLNEMRIGHACSLLTETDRPVQEIAYESGYNTPANFHKQFSRIKQTSPLQYRKRFAAGW